MKSIKLEGEAFEVAMDLHRTALGFHEKLGELQAEFMRLQAELNKAVEARWPKLLEAAGQKGADPSDFTLDAQYLPAHGLLFLNKDGAEPDDPVELPSPSGRKH